MAKTKEERKANREVRHARKKLRKEKFSLLLKLAKETPELSDDDYLDTPKKKFNTFWPVLQAALSFAAFLKITGEKVDLVIYRIIAIGNKMYDDTASDEESEEFIEKLQQIWGIVRKVLSTVTIFTDDNVDEILEKIIVIGDWVTSIDED